MYHFSQCLYVNNELSVKINELITRTNVREANGRYSGKTGTLKF